MKFLHLGDLHIGKTVNEFSMIDDQIYILNQIIETAVQRNADAIVIAGDVYDKKIPSEEAVRVFDDFLCRLSELEIMTYIISGNHDSEERLNFGSSLFEAKGIYIAAKYDGELKKITYQDDYGAVNLYLMPFLKASQVRRIYPESSIETYDEAVRVVLEHTPMDETARNILVAHQFVAGKSADVVLAGSEGLAVKTVGTVEQIGTDTFEKFDYVALGHIHSPQKLGQENIRYCGSPLKYSLSEVNNEKSMPLVTLEEKGALKVELIPLQPRRDMRHLTGKMEQLIKPENIVDKDDYIYVTLTDEDIITDAMLTLQQYYPNTMKIDYKNSYTKEMEEITFTDITKEKSFSELISDFYEMMYGCEISREELELMEQAAREAGVVE